VPAKPILLVTGMSGAGKSTVLRTLNDLGWEVVDNLPLTLLDRLLAAGPAPGGDESRPLAIGFGAETRGFDAGAVVKRIRNMSRDDAREISTLFLDCSGSELERRYIETRRRHPLADDRPATDGIARERELLGPLREFANRLIDTTDLSANELRGQVRSILGGDSFEPVLSVLSFGYARGLPRHADLVFDLRYLRNPHWVEGLRPGTGLNPEVAHYIAEDPSYASSMEQIENLLLTLLPRYRAEGKGNVTVAFGCTGGRHRSVHVADRVARRLREAGFSPTIAHRDLQSAPQDGLEPLPVAG
jgi:RNase adapter protein RapZ